MKKVDQRYWQKHEFWVLLLILASLGIRTVFVLFHPPENYLFSDMSDYYERALWIASGGSEDRSFAFNPPGTHYLFAPFIYWLNNPHFVLKLIFVLLSVGVCWFSYMFTKLFFDKWTALIVLTVFTFNYLFIRYTGYYLSEIPFSFGISLMFYTLIKSIRSKSFRKKSVFATLFGFTSILTATFKVNMLLFLPFFGIWWVFNGKKHQIYWNLPFYILGFVPLAIVLLLRMHSLTGHYGLSGNNGMNFYYGRAHLKYIGFVDDQGNYLEGWASPVADQVEGWTKKEYFHEHYTDNSAFFRKGWNLVKENPFQSLKYSMGYLLDMLTTSIPWPTGNKTNYMITKYNNLFICVFFVLPGALSGLIFYERLKRNQGILLWMGGMGVFIVAFIYFGSPRYRIPYDILFIPLAVYGYRTVYLTRIKPLRDRHFSSIML